MTISDIECKIWRYKFRKQRERERELLCRYNNSCVHYIIWHPPTSCSSTHERVMTPSVTMGLWGRTFSKLYVLSMQRMSGRTISSLREAIFGLNIIFRSRATPKVPSSSRFVNFMSEYFLSAGAEVRFEARSDSFYDDLGLCHAVLYRRANKTPPSGILRFVTLTISTQTFEYTIKRLLWESTQRGTSECAPQRWILLPFVSSTLQWRPR